jgi:hypothetical protein
LFPVSLLRYLLARSGHPRFVFGHSSFGFVAIGPDIKIFLRHHRSSVAPVHGLQLPLWPGCSRSISICWAASRNVPPGVFLFRPRALSSGLARSMGLIRYSCSIATAANLLLGVSSVQLLPPRFLPLPPAVPALCSSSPVRIWLSRCFGCHRQWRLLLLCFLCAKLGPLMFLHVKVLILLRF